MLKRVLLLCLGAWLIAAGGLSAHAGPCGVQKAQAEIEAKAAAHEHCDMMIEAGTAQPDSPQHEGQTANCCCPAVLSALPAPAVPESPALAFALPGDFPEDARAPSRNLIPEPPPPKV
jgi:hypothetical protein